MRIGLLFHGPAVFDSGWAERLCDLLHLAETTRSVLAVLAGTMGRTAALDSGCPGIAFAASPPSTCLADLARDSDVVVLGTCGTTPSSGLDFGTMVVARSGVTRNVVQVECTAKALIWHRAGAEKLCGPALAPLGFEVLAPPAPVARIRQDEDRLSRTMRSVQPGDFVFVNGIVIGRANSHRVEITCESGLITRVDGVSVKLHGLEKLARRGPLDLGQAKLASAQGLRPRLNQRLPSGEAPARMVEQDQRQRARQGTALVDHAGMHVYDLANSARGVVTVGDDTTAVVGEIMYRHRVPIVGITDGDLDGVIAAPALYPGSVILTVKNDDRLGLRIGREVFSGRTWIPDDLDTVRQSVLDLARNEIEGIRTLTA
jgi:hypothetical protein